MLKQIILRSRGSTHSWVDHPLLRGVIPADGRVKFGEAYAVPEEHPLQDMPDDRTAVAWCRETFAGVNFRVEPIFDTDGAVDEEDEGDDDETKIRSLRSRLGHATRDVTEQTERADAAEARVAELTKALADSDTDRERMKALLDDIESRAANEGDGTDA